MQHGRLRGTNTSKRSSMSSRTAHKSLPPMANSSSSCSPLSRLTDISASLHTTKQCASELRSGGICLSPTHPNLSTSTSSGSRTEEDPVLAMDIAADLQLPPPSHDNRLVEGSTLGPALTPPPPAASPTFASDARLQDTSPPHALSDVCSFVKDSTKQVSRFEGLESRPSYVRHFWWGGDDLPRLTLIGQSETLPPLPQVPDSVLAFSPAQQTIREHPKLFPIRTPINVDIFESYLAQHPNPAFAASVVEALCSGFWPWCDPSKVTLPHMLDAEEYLRKPADIAFAKEQCAKEVQLGRFTEIPELLPGMMAVPCSVVPKGKDGTKLRLVVDHSAGALSRNSMIDKSKVSVKLDGIPELGDALIRAREVYGQDADLVLFKCDVSEAYRTMPMSPAFQVWQIVRAFTKLFIDHVNNFGGRGSGGIWGSFFALVLWIACWIKGISDLLAYVDDVFSYELAINVLWYEPYQRFMPAKQTRLLQLWDELGIPHKDEKQQSGRALKIIGFEVDANAMSVTMPNQSRLDLIFAIREFAVMGHRAKLSDYQALAGWINWALNVYPLLRPSLSALYDKMAGKKQSFSEIYINKAVCMELLWAANHLETCGGVYFMNAIEWPPSDAEYVLLSDACLFGMGFWSPRHDLGFQARINPGAATRHIYFGSPTILLGIRKRKKKGKGRKRKEKGEKKRDFKEMDRFFRQSIS
ncbi:hypothetical protein BDZ97DRAFT_1873249 [Flammula alnicola]|nr:hypothetical protein BDZ97DRAFT_1873249 [Flammula alnicola]